MRITILDAALDHGIEPEEIRAVIEYPLDRTPLAARKPGSVPVLFIGKYTDNEPPIEVVADLAGAGEAVAFHGMMLRVSTAIAVGLHLRQPELVAQIVGQRPERRRTR